jgi:hypothetical protein
MKQNIVVRHVRDSNFIGFIYSEHLIPVTNESGSIEMRATIGVCWNNQRVPAISYHAPEELEWLEAQPIVVEELYTEEEEEDSEDADEEDEDIDASDTKQVLV